MQEVRPGPGTYPIPFSSFQKPEIFKRFSAVSGQTFQELPPYSPETCWSAVTSQEGSAAPP